MGTENLVQRSENHRPGKRRKENLAVQEVALGAGSGRPEGPMNEAAGMLTRARIMGGRLVSLDQWGQSPLNLLSAQS